MVAKAKIFEFGKAPRDDETRQAPTESLPQNRSIHVITEDPVDTSLRRLEEHGRLTANASGDVIPDKNRLAALDEFARGQVLALHAPAFDPDNNPEDRGLRNRLDVLSEQQRLLANDEVRLAARQREAFRAVPALEDPPRVSRLLLAFALTGFSLGFGASLVPLFSLNIEDTPLAWFASLAIGAAIGGLVTWSVFGIQDNEVDQ